MTYRDYFNAHTSENLSWCKTMVTSDGGVVVTMVECEISDIIVDDAALAPQKRLGLIKRFSDAQLRAVARLLDEDADERMEHRWSATELICGSDALHEIGCANCPYYGECEAMDAEYEDF